MGLESLHRPKGKWKHMDQISRPAVPNPILGSRFFVPDVEAHVWPDGRVYLYGSLDLPGRMEYCSDRYHVFSSDNLTDWVDHGVAFSLQDTAWAKDLGALYAPDCAYRDGTYYLYYCVPDGRCGVAVSSSPYGPFQDIGPIAHVHGIDPAVLLDDDGCAYLYWGQMDGVRAARLKDNLTEIDPATVSQPLSVREHEFHEGSSVKKIGGKYYYLFTDTHRHGGKATCLGYAVSDHPTTGFRYGGIVVDNFPCDPETWNNHGSLCRIGDTWYVFYHRSTHASRYSRWVCAEPVVFRPDGSIREYGVLELLEHLVNIMLKAVRVREVSVVASHRLACALVLSEIVAGCQQNFDRMLHCFLIREIEVVKINCMAQSQRQIRSDHAFLVLLRRLFGKRGRLPCRNCLSYNPRFQGYKRPRSSLRKGDGAADPPAQWDICLYCNC